MTIRSNNFIVNLSTTENPTNYKVSVTNGDFSNACAPITFTVNTTNVPIGTNLYWYITTTSNVKTYDFISNSFSGYATIGGYGPCNGVNTIPLNVNAAVLCRTTAGPKTFTFNVLNLSNTLPAAASANASLPDLPYPPTNIIATAFSTTGANIKFTAPLCNGGAKILYYTATANVGGYSNTIYGSGNGIIAIDGLPSGNTYTFVVQSHNSAGYSANSASSNPVTLLTVPDPPSSASLSFLGMANLKITYTAPGYNGGSNILYYTARSGCGALTGVHCGPYSNSIIINGIVPNRNYIFTVTAQNAIGASNATVAICTCTSSPVANLVAGGYIYDTPGTYTFHYPANVKYVSTVAIGGGAGGRTGGGGGGTLAYMNNIIKCPAHLTANIVVGTGGRATIFSNRSTPIVTAQCGGESSFSTVTYIAKAPGGRNPGPLGILYTTCCTPSYLTSLTTLPATLTYPAGANVTAAGHVGGQAGRPCIVCYYLGLQYGRAGGGGGAGGYTCGGGSPRSWRVCSYPGYGPDYIKFPDGYPGYGGSGGGGAGYDCSYNANIYAGTGGGGGAGVYGIPTGVSTAVAGGNIYIGGYVGGGRGGYGGCPGGCSRSTTIPVPRAGGSGGKYGGGGGGYENLNHAPLYMSGNGAGGVVRVVWPGNFRKFPSSNVALNSLYPDQTTAP